MTTQEDPTFPTEPDTTIGVGDKVRSYDHHGDDGIYIEGVVEALITWDGCQRYKILVERDIRDGKERPGRVGTRVFPPINGTPTWLGETTCGVVRQEKRNKRVEYEIAKRDEMDAEIPPPPVGKLTPLDAYEWMFGLADVADRYFIVEFVRDSSGTLERVSGMRGAKFLAKGEPRCKP